MAILKALKIPAGGAIYDAQDKPFLIFNEDGTLTLVGTLIVDKALGGNIIFKNANLVTAEAEE